MGMPKSPADRILFMAWALIPGMTAVYVCDYVVGRWLIGDMFGVNIPEAVSYIAQALAGLAAGYAGIRFRMSREKRAADNL